MRAPSFSLRRAAMLFATPLALTAVLAACGDSGSGSQVVVPAPLPSGTGTSTPTPTPTAVTYNVDNCFTQTVQGQTGVTATVKSQIIPDTLKLDISRPFTPTADGSGNPTYPNGRYLADQVVDLLLAELLLDMNVTGQGPYTLARVPLDPPRNDKPFNLSFPYLALPNGSPSIASGTGSGFNFRTDADSAYVSVDRMGNPAIATVLVRSANKNAFNDDTPANDAVNDKWFSEFEFELDDLFNLIGDDLTNLGLKICARTS
ncbi:DUF4331 domain-containing protein [Novosphingobium sp. NBM11]|uniref:DUF4331 family protein n=1 Tax=Novosphingobium sp. NBM11 TaxID=2596914 RepID=UPI00189229B2|nr:DUF4331 family protein [Novosphingobium sp. NBM11]MBF5089334.1 DUF4331 domain-containing protein [Novosphingobium sp. NBM11]